MRRIYSLAVLLVMLLASTTAKAQNFEGSVTVGFYESQNYKTAPISFSLTAIADAFGISDAATLAAMLDDQYPEDRDDAIDRGFQMYEIQSDNSLFEGIYNDEQKTFTADPIGFYLNKDGDVVTWSSADDIWYYIPRWDAETDEFYFSCGRKAADASFTEGYTGTGTFYLRYNGAIALSFKLTYTVEPKPEVQPNETTLSKLTMKEGVDVVVNQKPRSNYDADEVTIAVPTLLADLGFANQTELIMSEALYAQVYEHDAVADMYEWADSITNESTANEPGFWFGPTYEYQDLDADPIENRTNLARHEWNSSCLFYAEAFQFFREEGEDFLKFNVGQYGGNAGDNGEDYHVTLYIVNGSVAYPVRINLVIDRVEKKDFADMEMAGETTLVVKLLAGEPTTNTSVAAINDMDAVLEALGEASASDLEYYGLDSEGVLSTRQTANGGGSWFNGDGYVVSYGSDRDFYIEFDSSKATWTVGTYTLNNHVGGDRIEMKYYLLGRLKYWEFNVTILYTTDETDYSTWQKVGTIPMTIQGIVPTEGYEVTQIDGNIIPMDKVRELLGSSSVALYGQKRIPATEEGAPEKITWSNAYSCDPHPGFWMEDNGQYVSSWGNWGDGGSSYGMTVVYSTGYITVWNEPGRRQPGETYKATFYLANVAAETYVELPVVIKFTDSLVPIETLGEQDIVIAWDVEDGGISYGFADLSEVIETLFEGDASLFESCDWYFFKDGEFIQTTGIDIEWNVFDENGEYLANQDDDNFGEMYDASSYSVGFDFDEQAFGVESSFDGGMVWGLSEVVKTDIAMDYNGKRWIFHCYIGDKETIETGINNVVVNNDSKKEVFDLTGRRVAAPVKGLYIVNGKKVMMK